MMERYSHIRVAAREAAIAALEVRIRYDFEPDGAQNWAQSQAALSPAILAAPEKALN